MWMSSKTIGPSQPSFTLPKRTAAWSAGTASATSFDIRAGLDMSQGRLPIPSTAMTATVASVARTCDDRNAMDRNDMWEALCGGSVLGEVSGDGSGDGRPASGVVMS